MTENRRSDLETLDDLLQETLQNDEEFARSWEVTEVVARFGAQVFKERSRQEISQKQLAEQVGTGQPNVSRIEHGAGNPTLETMAKIARALHVDLSNLLQRRDASIHGSTLSIRPTSAAAPTEPAGQATGLESSESEPWGEAGVGRGRRFAVGSDRRSGETTAVTALAS